MQLREWLRFQQRSMRRSLDDTASGMCTGCDSEVRSKSWGLNPVFVRTFLVSRGVNGNREAFGDEKTEIMIDHRPESNCKLRPCCRPISFWKARTSITVLYLWELKSCFYPLLARSLLAFSMTTLSILGLSLSSLLPPYGQYFLQGQCLSRLPDA